MVVRMLAVERLVTNYGQTVVGGGETSRASRSQLAQLAAGGRTRRKRRCRPPRRAGSVGPTPRLHWRKTVPARESGRLCRPKGGEALQAPVSPQGLNELTDRGGYVGRSFEFHVVTAVDDDLPAIG